jgi:hypothetical protein
MKVAKGTDYVRRFAGYVEYSADDPEQALIEIPDSHARDSEDSPIAPTYLKQRAPVHQAAREATAGDADPDSLPRHLRATAATMAVTPASTRETGTELRLRTNLTTRTIADTGKTLAPLPGMDWPSGPATAATTALARWPRRATQIVVRC